MDQTLQIAIVYDTILVVLVVVVGWVAYQAGKAIHAFTKMSEDGPKEGEAVESFSARSKKAQRKAASMTSIAVLLIITLFVYANREAVWFRPEPKPVANPERSLRIEEISGRQIIVNEPVNVPERQKMDPEDLAVKEKVENMEDLEGAPDPK